MRAIYQGETANNFKLRLAHIECENEVKEARARVGKTLFDNCIVYADNYCIDIKVTDKEEFNTFMDEWKRAKKNK